jgi:hypothetical protein
MGTGANANVRVRGLCGTVVRFNDTSHQCKTVSGFPQSPTCILHPSCRRTKRHYHAKYRRGNLGESNRLSDHKRIMN